MGQYSASIIRVIVAIDDDALVFLDNLQDNRVNFFLKVRGRLKTIGELAETGES
jgi:hypothetical protein